MNKELQKVYEMMAKLSPEFKLNEGPTFDSSFGDSFNTNNSSSNANDLNNQPELQNTNSDIDLSNINQQSIVDDNTLTVGELKTCLKILSKSKTSEEALLKLKSIGGDVLKIGIGMIPVIGNVIGTGIDSVGLLSKLFKPKKQGDSEIKSPNEFMKLLQIDKEVSILLDDNIEYAFIKYATAQLESMADTIPIPDFFEELKKFIKEKYSSYYNLIKS